MRSIIVELHRVARNMNLTYTCKNQIVIHAKPVLYNYWYTTLQKLQNIY